MKVTIRRESFASLFQSAASVAPSRSPKPILQHVKLSVEDNQLSVAATDLEIGVQLNIPEVEIQQPGAAVVPVTRLNMILRETTDETLVIETADHRTLIRGERARFELAGFDPDEYPIIPGFEETQYFEIDAPVLRELIRRTQFATDTESTRFALGGVLLEIEGDRITAVGTDGRRLAKMEGSVRRVGEAQQPETTTIIPTRAMQLLDRVLPGGEEAVRLALRNNDVVVGIPNGFFYSRLVEGRFPRWRDVIPQRRDAKHVSLPVGPLYSALRQASVVANDENRGIDFTFAPGTLTLSNNTAEVGQSQVEMPISYDQEEVTIALDSRYLADFLRVLSPDVNITMEIENSEQAAYCTTDDHYGYVVMPLARERRQAVRAAEATT